jgi:hypothetical protein
MHYIIGQRIIVKEGLVPASSGLRSIGAQPIKRKVATEEFKRGTAYMLYYIKKVDEGVLYTFKSDDGDLIDKPFKSTADGDRFIARLLGENLPDYGKFYKESN